MQKGDGESVAVLLAQGVSPVCDHLPLVPTALSGLDEEVAVRLLDVLLSRGMEWWYAAGGSLGAARALAVGRPGGGS